MRNILKKIWAYILKHKIISFFALIVIIIIGYQVSKSLTNTLAVTTYISGQVTRETIITSVSGTGQVSALNQVDLKTKTSGDLIYLNATAGKEVSTGALIAKLDSGDASYELESAKISYDELINIDPNDLRKAEDVVTDAKKSVVNSYSDGKILIIKASTDLSDILENINSLFSGYLNSSKIGLSNSAKEYIHNAENKYNEANDAFILFLKKYRAVPEKIDNATIESLISTAEDISSQILDTSKLAKDAVVYQRDRENDPTVALSSYTLVNNMVTSAGTTYSNILAAKDSILNSNRALTDAEISLEDLKDGPDTLELRTQELSLKQKQEALLNYSVNAPFSGVIASVASINIGDTLNNGTTVATLITKQKIAEISLNEIDAAKVKVGQKAKLTFDAIDGLSIAGTVAEVNLIGTVSQGVVSYTTKISFDTQDDRVKSGMSVSASIIYESKVGVLTVPNSAIKNQGNKSYVEMPGASDTDVPTKQIVTVGISNDTVTEILSGLKEGDFVVVKTKNGTTNIQAVSKTSSVSSILSGNRSGR